MDSYGNAGFRGVSKQRAELSALRSKNIKTESLIVDNTAILNEVVVDSTLDVSGLVTLTGGLRVSDNEGVIVEQIQSGSVSVNPGSIGATTKGSVNVTISGLVPGNHILLDVPSGLNAGLLYVGHSITANNTLTIYLYNKTGGAIDDGAFNWNYMWFGLD